MSNPSEAKSGLIASFRHSVQSEPGTAVASAVTLVTSIAGTVALAKLAGGFAGLAVAAVGLYASVKVVKDALNCVRHKEIQAGSSQSHHAAQEQETKKPAKTPGVDWARLRN